MRRRAAVASLVALAIAGCGGSSGSMKRFRAQAGRVCTKALDAGALIPAPAVPASTAAFLRHGIAVLGPQLAGLRRLRPPGEQADEYRTAVDALDRELTILAATVHDLDRGADPLRAIKTLQRRLAPIEATEDAAWRTLDVPACVNR
jgi:hypothetical protein